MKQSNIVRKKENTKKQPSEEQAKEAVRTLISWAGDNLTEKVSKGNA